MPISLIEATKMRAPFADCPYNASLRRMHTRIPIHYLISVTEYYAGENTRFQLHDCICPDDCKLPAVNCRHSTVMHALLKHYFKDPQGANEIFQI